MRPKKKPPNAIQNMIIAMAEGLGSSKSNAPGRKRMTNIATNIAGDPSRMPS